MKPISFFLFLSVLVGLQVTWGKETPQVRTPSDPKAMGIMLASGIELRPEKDVDSSFQNHFFTNYALGYGWDQYVLIFEAASFQEVSGNSTLNIRRTFQDYMLWGQYRDTVWHRMVPFMGLGAGAYQETVETRIYADSRTDAGPSKFLAGVSLGVATDFPVVWLSVEARVLVGDELDSNPSVGALARIGIHF